MTRARRCGLVAAQAGCAAAAIDDRVLDLGVLGQRDLGLHLAGIGIEHIAEPPRTALDLLAADEMADLAHRVLHEFRRALRPFRVGPFHHRVAWRMA